MKYFKRFLLIILVIVVVLVAGFVIWAETPLGPSSGALAAGMKVVLIYGTNDGLGTLEGIAKARKLLPVDRVYVSREGGNHGQFGSMVHSLVTIRPRSHPKSSGIKL